MKSTVTKAHVEIYRAVEGAVRNVEHHHPNWIKSKDAARSIAKRAAGTLTARWPDVLAGREAPSEQAGGVGSTSHWPPRRAARTLRGRGAPSKRHVGAPNRGLWKHLSILVGEAKRNGQTDRAETLIEILRFISAH